MPFRNSARAGTAHGGPCLTPSFPTLRKEVRVGIERRKRRWAAFAPIPPFENWLCRGWTWGLETVGRWLSLPGPMLSSEDSRGWRAWPQDRGSHGGRPEEHASSLWLSLHVSGEVL